MIAVIFEAQPHSDQRQRYLDIAAELKPLLDDVEGFISIERFQSLADPERLLSLSLHIRRDLGVGDLRVHCLAMGCL
ncbi:antibiotic biosynthesis monooxygenase family protein [Halomonas elongata]